MAPFMFYMLLSLQGSLAAETCQGSQCAAFIGQKLLQVAQNSIRVSAPGACQDDDNGIVEVAKQAGFTISGCGDVASYCQHSEYGQTVLAKCPQTCGSCATTYVPGQPGVAWTTEQMLAIKAKLWRSFREAPEATGAGLGIAAEAKTEWEIELPKYVRLGFHDCMKYADGTGGCDGCLDWAGVGNIYPEGRRTSNDIRDHNNGLQEVVKVLELVYTDPAFPRMTPVLSKSPKELGMSRADLWAFASMMAIEFGISLNNAACNDPDFVKKTTPRHDCHPRQGEPDCLVKRPRQFRFSTGRRDCIPNATNKFPYMTWKHESPPDAGGNGEKTLNWFKREFNFSGRETVAIMGGHTLGRMDRGMSSFEYTWKTRSGHLFNNGYYRNMVGKPDWFYPTKQSATGGSFRSGPNGGSCRGVGNSSGMRPLARWRPNAFGKLPNGGPNQWIQEKFTCACFGVGEDGKPVESTCCPKGMDRFTCAKDDGTGAAGAWYGNRCEQWMFVLGEDESMLNVDMGLYRNFSVNAAGIPIADQPSCPGLIVGLGHQGGWNSESCAFNTIQSPVGSTPVYKIVEEFADSNEKFLAAFYPAYEKMLTNGYTQAELHSVDLPVMRCDLQNPANSSRQYACKLG